MKWFLSFILIFVGFMGCSSNPNNLTLSPYKPKIYTTSKGTGIKKIYIKSVADLREHPALVGSFEKDGKTYGVMSRTRVATWLYDALERGLEKRGFKLVQSPQKEALRVKVVISKLNVRYTNIKNSNNTFGDLVLGFSMDRGLNNQMEKIKTYRQTYNSSLPDKEQYEAYIYEMLDDAVGKILKKISISHEMYRL